ncbi:MAG TPA: ABC transporter permease [Vicinamibacterales bacterium]|nr:ABC transporter permease [Vicinamibacterales bacterium]
MRTLIRDLRHALRMLGRQPAFAGVAIVTLALGVGAATAVFTIVNGVLLRPLPYRDPGRLVILYYGHQGRVSPWFSPLNVRDYVGRADAFTDASAIAPISVNMTGLADPERLQGARVSWNYFAVMGTPMTLGRPFEESDAQGDGNQVIISDGLWRRRFGARQDIVNSTATFDGAKTTIIGVAPASMRFPATAEFWQPLIFKPRDLAPAARSAQWVQVLARLKATVSADQATIALQTIASSMAIEFPETEKDATVSAVSLHERIVRGIRPALMTVFGSVALVLLIACANVANLLLARGHARGREVAVRAALGASRRQLIAQLLSESLVLGTLGGAAGAGVAFWMVRALTLLAPSSIPRLQELAVDMNVLGFSVALALLTSIVSGLAPALAISGRSIGRSFLLRDRGAAGASGTRARRVLVMSELAGAAMLLVAAGLLIRSYVELQRVAPGFDPEGVTTFSVALPVARYSDPDSPRAFVASLLSSLRSEPGIESAAVAMGLPFTNDLNALSGFRHEGRAVPDSASMPVAGLRVVSPEYFNVMKIPIRAGRTFDHRDTAASPDVALINEQAARRYFAGEDPIGQQIRVTAALSRDARKGPKTIVGIVGDIKYGGLDEDTPAEIYLPYEQQAVDAFTVAVRGAGGRIASIPAMRRDVSALDPLLPLAHVERLTSLVDASLAGRRFTMLVLLSFAAIAVVLAMIGVYGVLAYMVGQRRREIGVRLAIGASPSDVVWMFVREGATLTLVGLIAGLIAALAAGRWISSLLFSVTPADPLTLAIVIGALAAAAACAAYVPARRAAGVDPSEALKFE